MSDQTKNIFISHIHEDDSELGSMKALLATAGFTLRDSSVNSSNPNEASSEGYIKSEILAPKIQWASTLVVLISPGTHESDWVNWEIDYAHKLGKRIVGVWAHGAKDSDVPTSLDLYADAVVGWQGERIRGAICGEINNWTTSEGQLRDPRPIPRINC